MEYVSVSEIANAWGVSERSVRNYCAQGRVEGAILVGKTWRIPLSAVKPTRRGRRLYPLLERLIAERAVRLSGGIYHKTQIQFTYNSNHIEGSRLSEEQTRYIYETNTIGIEDVALDVDDIIQTSNHFRCIDYVIDNATSPISERLVKQLHKLLKSGTSDERNEWFRVGDYKALPNEIGGRATTPPSEVAVEMAKLIRWYESLESVRLEDIVEFHYRFENIHPFQDGNGRVGRLIAYKECLRHSIVPFIITDDIKYYYYQGLREWRRERGYLMDTLLTAQDRYKAYLDYYEIEH